MIVVLNLFLGKEFWIFYGEYGESGVGRTRWREFGTILSMAEKGELIPADYETPAEFAKRRKLSLRTVHRWLRLKIVKGDQPAGAKGKWMIPR